MTLSEELKWRGFVNQTTFADLSVLDKKKWTFYHGFDASGDSLTIGNLAAIMLDKCFLRHGHEAILLAGGATSLIGDPGGKDVERPLQDEKLIEANVAAVKKQIEGLFGNNVTMVNNLNWFKNMSVLEFLRDVGKHFSMTPLVQRDYIAKRMGQGGDGISYTEFSYTILQGYDFLHLYREHGANLQLSGSDQWGNCLSGVELIRRVENKEVHAFTMPLILNKTTGKKFGKSEDGAVWLGPNKTSIYQFYQFWLNVDDEGVADYLKVFTELDKPTVALTMAEFEDNRASRRAQKVLAYEVTKLVHGKDKADSVKRATETLFGDASYSKLSHGDINMLKGELRVTNAKIGKTLLVEVLVNAGLAKSNTEARRYLVDSGVYINGLQFSSDKTTFEPEDSIHGHAIIRRGKNTQAVVQLSD